MSLVLGTETERGPCKVCGTALCSCRGQNEPYVGRPIDLATMVERGDGSFSALLAKERIFVDRPGIEGARELLYNVGDPIREPDAIALGLIDPETKEVVRMKAPETKVQKSPREKPQSGGTAKVPRDKAMRGPRDKKEQED